MNRIRVTKEFGFEMAHALWNYDGACRNIHGHSYKLFVTVAGVPCSDPGHPKFGMVIDFTDLKMLVKEPVVDFLDHSLVVYHASEGASLSAVRSLYEKVHVFDFQPTCENLVLYIVEKIGKKLPAGVDLCSVKLYETATSFAEWQLADNT
jgi:6-pyruvoyltetrahydropterin/6-carboxytetrahydropterin synthase